MRYLALILLWLPVFCLQEERSYFRFKNAMVSFGEAFDRAEGTVFIETSYPSGDSIVMIFGITTAFATPFSLIAVSDSSKTSERNYKCDQGTEYRNYWDLKGGLVVKGTPDRIELKSNCIYDRDIDLIFEGIANRTSKYRYHPNDAVLRARNLVGEKIERFKAHELLGYAIYDNPYSLFENCNDFLHERFMTVTSYEAGNIVVGKDGKHCAILDGSDYSFIQSNPFTKLVTFHRIAELKQYFQNEYFIKKYPDDWPY